MTKYISDVRLVVAHNGTSALFIPGTPRVLRESLVGPALARGVRVYGEQAPQPTATQTTSDAATDEAASNAGNQVVEITHEAVVAAIRELMEAGDKAAFGRDDIPNLAPLRAKLGKGVTAEMRDAAWAEVRESRTEE